MNACNRATIMMAISHFFGTRKVIGFDDIVEVATKQYGFSGCVDEARILISNNRDLELVQLKDPRSQELGWFLKVKDFQKISAND
ncbi:MAG: hypothetical protein AB8B55_20150 [Mariniblastus sp.]